ncbi:MAG: radical SAM family heme chaperone HemW [bacterium]|nr:radical SAM family heme chaperone HemW [bacterium]
MGLYIHIPFCRKKCGYCSFYSVCCAERADVSGFIRTLKTELRDYNGLDFETLYIGGGTPTAVSDEDFDGICGFAAKVKGEKTIEANPESLSSEKISILKKHGFDRLSIGLQSPRRGDLGFLGRIHSPEDFDRCFAGARSAGVKNINIDLIYGLQNQGLKEWMENLEKVTEYEPEHISCYCLSLEKGSAFHEKSGENIISLPCDDITASMFLKTHNFLESKGYDHYEISNFAKSGKECAHNMNYWKNGQYAGLGPSAWSFIKNIRFKNISDLGKYMVAAGTGKRCVEEEDRAEKQVRFYETICMGLRMKKGINIEYVSRAHNMDFWDFYRDTVEEYYKEGFLSVENGYLKPTLKGMLFHSAVASEFVLL